MTEKKITPGILVLSHGSLCTALIESAALISGSAEGVVGIPLEAGADISEYANHVRAMYQAMPDGSIILIDLFGGTPCNQIVMMNQELPIYALCGVNLPMLLDAMALRTAVKGSALIKSLEKSTHETIVNMAEFLVSAKYV